MMVQLSLELIAKFQEEGIDTKWITVSGAINPSNPLSYFEVTISHLIQSSDSLISIPHDEKVSLLNKCEAIALDMGMKKDNTGSSDLTRVVTLRRP